LTLSRTFILFNHVKSYVIHMLINCSWTTGCVGGWQPYNSAAIWFNYAVCICVGWQQQWCV